MNVIETALEGVLIIEPRVFGDARGYFFETYQHQRYAAAGMDRTFVQDNLSFSRKGVLRGLHFQKKRPQAKLVQVIQGEVFDVAVDLRKDSPTYGKWTGTVLSETNQRQFFMPEGIAHGFCVTSETAHLAYKCTDYYAPDDECGIIWNDADLAIQWPIDNPLLSEKDLDLPRFAELNAIE